MFTLCAIIKICHFHMFILPDALPDMIIGSEGWNTLTAGIAVSFVSLSTAICSPLALNMFTDRFMLPITSISSLSEFGFQTALNFWTQRPCSECHYLSGCYVWLIAAPGSRTCNCAISQACRQRMLIRSRLPWDSRMQSWPALLVITDNLCSISFNGTTKSSSPIFSILESKTFKVRSSPPMTM